MSDSIDIVTFGCRLNTYESQVMGDHACAQGVKDAILFNTCAVTAEAERQARQAIRRARRERPDARIVVTGCAAQIDPAKWSAMDEVDQVIGNREKLAASTFAAGFGENGFGDEPVRVNDIFDAEETAQHLVGGFEGRSRAFVQVQNGCDHRCTFCIIPYGRGNSRSVPLGPIVEQIRTLVDTGYNEIVLTGVDITSYGADLPGRPTLGQMVRRLLDAVPGLPRLRLTSIDSIEADDDLWRLIAEEPRFLPHLHLSLQAGDDMILKRMKRRHTRAESIAFCDRARALRPDIVFGADLIAGFPTETEAMFENSLALIEQCGLTYLHVFPYSERPGTPAAHMPQLPKADRKARAKRLREAGDAALTRFLEGQVGGTVTALVERPGRARTDHYAVARVPETLPEGAVVDLRITGADAQSLIGVAA